METAVDMLVQLATLWGRERVEACARAGLDLRVRLDEKGRTAREVAAHFGHVELARRIAELTG